MTAKLISEVQRNDSSEKSTFKRNRVLITNARLCMHTDAGTDTQSRRVPRSLEALQCTCALTRINAAWTNSTKAQRNAGSHLNNATKTREGIGPLLNGEKQAYKMAATLTKIRERHLEYCRWLSRYLAAHYSRTITRGPPSTELLCTHHPMYQFFFRRVYMWESLRSCNLEPHRNCEMVLFSWAWRTNLPSIQHYSPTMMSTTLTNSQHQVFVSNPRLITFSFRETLLVISAVVTIV